ncbi:MAG: hypothetical protein V4534_08560 [Myxococcota bacterium]
MLVTWKSVMWAAVRSYQFLESLNNSLAPDPDAREPVDMLETPVRRSRSNKSVHFDESKNIIIEIPPRD